MIICLFRLFRVTISFIVRDLKFATNSHVHAASDINVFFCFASRVPALRKLFNELAPASGLYLQ